MNPNFKLIQSLQRAFDIINCFSEIDQTLNLNEISNMVNLNINTTRGLVQTLVYFSYLKYNSKNNTYRIGDIFLEKYLLAKTTKIREILNFIKPDMQTLADNYQVSVRLLSINNFNILTTEVINPINSRYVLSTQVNVELPLYASSSGKLLLYYLDEKVRKEILSTIKWKKFTDNTIVTEKELMKSLKSIEKNGYAIENEELGYGISSISFPIVFEKELIFTLSITTNTKVLDMNFENIKNNLEKISKKISELY